MCICMYRVNSVNTRLSGGRTAQTDRDVREQMVFSPWLAADSRQLSSHTHTYTTHMRYFTPTDKS